MNSRSLPAGRLSAGELASLSIMAALTFAAKMALCALPNVHLGAVMIILAAVYFGWKAMYMVAVYVLLEGLVFGFGLWWSSYLYAWPLLCAAAVLLRRADSVLAYAVLAGAHGLCFGALCAVPYVFISGLPAAVAWWISGIPFDLIHCVSNFALTLILIKPLGAVMRKIIKANPPD